MYLCRGGSRMTALCVGGALVDGVCEAGDAFLVFDTGTNGGGGPGNPPDPLVGTLTFAPSAANPGGADPNSGTDVSLLDITEDIVNLGGGNLQFAMAIEIAGGVAPFDVDFSGVTWSVSNDLDPAFARFTDVNAQLGQNQHLVDTSVAGPISVPGTAGSNSFGGTLPVGSIVNVASNDDFAALSIWNRMIVPVPLLSPPDVDEFPMTVTYDISGTVTITDALGTQTTVNGAGSDSFTVTPTGGSPVGGGGGGLPP